MPVSLRQASPRSCVITEETFAEVSIQVYSHRFVMEGPAALSNIYCPSQLFLTHVLKILTLSQSFKRSGSGQISKPIFHQMNRFI